MSIQTEINRVRENLQNFTNRIRAQAQETTNVLTAQLKTQSNEANAELQNLKKTAKKIESQITSQMENVKRMSLRNQEIVNDLVSNKSSKAIILEEMRKSDEEIALFSFSLVHVNQKILGMENKMSQMQKKYEEKIQKINDFAEAEIQKTTQLIENQIRDLCHLACL